MPIETGLTYETSWLVTDQHTAAVVTEGKLPNVLSTPHLLGWIESTSHDAIAGFLTSEQASVGTFICLKHSAATPLGMQVRIQVKIIEVSGKRLRYQVEAWDAVEKIAEAEHERFIIDVNRFTQNVDKKKKNA
jgi:fluoroacetyl-CoA thioesterase